MTFQRSVRWFSSRKAKAPMMSQPRTNGTSETATLGERVGELRSTSESVQKFACLVGIGAGVAAGAVTEFSAFVILPVTIGVAASLYFLAKRLDRFSSCLRVYEHGATLNDRGKHYRFCYADVESMRVVHQHHMMKNNYIGSRVQYEMTIAGQVRPLRCDLEYHREKPSRQTIDAFSALTSTAQQQPLSARLEAEGQLRWTDDLYLTLDGLRVVDSAGTTLRELDFQEIERWQIADNQLKFFKAGDGLPCLVTSIDHPNFHAIGMLFASLHECYAQHDQAAAAAAADDSNRQPGDLSLV